MDPNEKKKRLKKIPVWNFFQNMHALKDNEAKKYEIIKKKKEKKKKKRNEKKIR